MNTLTNTNSVSPAARRVMALLALVVTVTSTNVQTARATDVLPDAPTWVTDEVAQNDAKITALTVPVIKTEEKKQEVTPAIKTKKKWNTINAVDTETKAEHSSEPAVRTMVVASTAYNSEVGQTDGSPFTTANGTQVYDGVIAANFLPFGTRVRIPDHFGDKVFVVHDRMNARYTQRVDVWMLTKKEAFQWGVRKVKIEVLP
jgi:3D (Asp-Asp-Asp) domain-containing protein